MPRICDGSWVNLVAAMPDVAPHAGALLLITGADDTVVAPSVSEAAAMASVSEDVTVSILDGADHVFRVLTADQTLADQVITTTADRYAAQLWTDSGYSVVRSGGSGIAGGTPE